MPRAETAVKPKATGIEVEDNRMTKTTKPKPMIASVPLADLDETINMLYIGDGGTGKTTDLAHMAHLGRILFISAESGVKARPLRKMGVPIENVAVIPDPNKGDPISYPMLEDLYWQLKGELEDDPGSWAGVVWDSFTDIHMTLLQNVGDEARKRLNDKGLPRRKDVAPGSMADVFFTDLDDYNVMTSQMRKLIRRFRDLPIHFGGSALERRDKDDDGKVRYSAAVNPALAGDLQGYMDIVCYTSVAEVGGEDEYQGLTRPVRMRKGKDRWKVLPKVLIDPTFDRIYAYLKDEIDLETDPVMAQARQRRDQDKLRADAMTAETQSDDDQGDA